MRESARLPTSASPWASMCQRVFYVHLPVCSVHSCVNTHTVFPHTQLYTYEGPCVTTHPHKARFLHGVQQTDPQVFTLVVHGDHVESYRLWHGQDDG